MKDKIKMVRSNFSQVPNDLLRDENISLKTKGLYSLIYSLPENWDFSINGIVCIVKEGRKAIDTAIKEMIENGYCIRKSNRKDGKFDGFEYEFLVSPHRPFPHTEKPHTEKPHTEKGEQYNKDRNNKDKTNKEGSSNYAEKNFSEKNEIENKETLEENFSFEKNEKRKKVSQKKEKSKSILFSESPFSDFEVFKSAFIGTKYEIYDLEYYYEAVSNWSSSSNAKKIDWIATARGFILRDIGSNKAKLPNTQKNENMPVKTAKKTNFEDSQYFDLDKFKNEILKDEEYACFDTNFYYQKIKLWASTSQAQVSDWIATAKKFMLTDLQENKAKLINNNFNNTQNVKSTNNPNPFDRLERAANKVREAFANAGDINF